MKFTCAMTAAFIRLAPVQSARIGWSSSPSSSVDSSPPSPAGSVDTKVPICGAGFTYCGYILRDHQNFKEEDIIKAYCASHKDNCVNGRTKTDPLQALYVCVPPGAAPALKQATATPTITQPPKKPWNYKTHWRGTPNLKDDNADPDKLITPRNHHYYWHSPWQNTNADDLFNNLLSPNRHHQNQHSSSTTSATPTATETATQTQSQPWAEPQPPSPVSVSISASPSDWSEPQAPSPVSVSPSNGGSLNNNSSTINTCSSAAVPGNKIELLCSCSGQCLNPLSDHIGRCDMPCS